MKRILLIEDDPFLRENTAELLELANYSVITASNGKVGLEKAKINLPDIIVCDIMMPELGGYAVLEELEKSEKIKHIPFIFLSAKTTHDDIKKGMNMGADDYITKPFDEDELVDAIESRLAKVSILEDLRRKQEKYDETNEGKIKTYNDLKKFFYDKGELFNYTKDSFIYREGHHSNYTYLIRKGVVKCHKLDRQGKELTTALHNKDNLFGYTSFTQNIPHQESATAIKDTELVGVSRNQLKNMLSNNHKITLELIQLLTDDLSNVKKQLLQMAYSSVNRKTANTILRFAEKLNRKPKDPIRISRNDLASVAGIAPETFIRTMSNFKKQGLIEIEGRNIKILDINKLQEIQ